MEASELLPGPECFLEARVPRSNCPEHGVLSVAVPWAREGSGLTLLFEALAMLLCREMPMAAVADALGEHDTRLWRVAAHYVEAAHAKNSWAKVRAISVDETVPTSAIATWAIVLDAQHMNSREVNAAGSVYEEAWPVAHGGKVQQIELISMDMSPAYQSGASQFFPQAQIVFDAVQSLPQTRTGHRPARHAPGCPCR